MKRQRPIREDGEKVMLPLQCGTEGFGNGILTFWKSGKRTYIWIGDADGAGGRCYGHFSGEATLRKLARAILREVEP